MARFSSLLFMLDRRGATCHEPPTEVWRDHLEVWEQSVPASLGGGDEAAAFDEAPVELVLAE